MDEVALEGRIAFHSAWVAFGLKEWGEFYDQPRGERAASYILEHSAAMRRAQGRLIELRLVGS